MSFMEKFPFHLEFFARVEFIYDVQKRMRGGDPSFSSSKVRRKLCKLEKNIAQS
jgi:flagellar motor switch protein FliM